MSLLTPATSPPSAAASPLPGLGRPADSERRDQPVRPVERSHPARPARDGRVERPDGREAGGRQSDTATDRPLQPSRALVPAPEFQAPESGVTVFLVQVLGQNRGQPGHGLTGHRDAAALGTAAYRRAGGAPPAVSEEPAVLRISA
jgi:hypothetical protein